MKPEDFGPDPVTQARLNSLLDNPPDGADGRAEWVQAVLRLAAAPLAAAQAALEAERQQRVHSQTAEQVLRVENERLRARLAGLRESETSVHVQAETFRSLADNSPDLILRVDRDWNRLYANPAAEAALREGDYYSFVLERLASGPNPIETGQAARSQLTYPAADGERWYDVRVVPEAGPGGAVETLLVVARDITERKREEANNHFLSTIAQSMVSFSTPEQVLRGLPELVGAYLNVPRCFLIALEDEGGGYEVRGDYHPGQESIIGPVPEHLRPPELLRRLAAGLPVIIDDLAANPHTADFFHELFAPNDIRALVLVPWPSGNRKTGWLLGVAADQPRAWQPEEISLLHSVANLTRLTLENTQLLGDLKDFRQRFELALRAAPITVFTMDSDLRLNWIFNPPAHFSLEKEPPDATVTPLYSQARSVIASQQSERRELRLDTPLGPAYFDVTIEPLFDEQGAVTGAAAAAIETTQLRRMEAEAVDNLAQIEVQHRLIAERELERSRIARELHDGPLQDLIAASFNLVEAMDIAEKDARLAKMRLIQSMLQAQIRALRRFYNDLRPPVLAPFGLEKTIRSHAEALSELYPDLRIRLDLQPDGKRVPEDRRMTVYRIYQELINNVLRHAQASEVTISLRLLRDSVQLEVKDNGVGIVQTASWLDLARQGHLGLVGVRERVELFGGQVEMHSKPEQGTVVRVSVPLR